MMQKYHCGLKRRRWNNYEIVTGLLASIKKEDHCPLHVFRVRITGTLYSLLNNGFPLIPVRINATSQLPLPPE